MSVREDIKAYIDGELSPERMEEVRKALESDPELMEEYTTMKDITQKLQSLVRQPQVQGVEKTKAAVAPARRFRWKEGLAVAAGLIILAFFVAPVFSRAKSASTVAVLDRAAGAEATYDDALANADAEFKSRDFGGVAPPSGGLRASAGVPTDDMKDKGFYGVSPMREDHATKRPMAAGERGLNNMAVPSAAGQAPTKEELAPGTVTNANADFENRLVIKDASFTVKVKDVKEAMDKATHLANTYKGYIESSAITQTQDDVPTAGMITVRLRQENFEKAVGEIRGYGNVTSENTSGDDVTGQVTDIEARINTLKSEEESLRTILRSATKIGDVLEIKDRISQVRMQIESYDSQRRVLTRLAALATISVRFTTDKKDVKQLAPKDKDEAWFDDTKDAAMAVLTGVGKFVAQVFTFAFILLPVWAPVLLFLLWFRRRALVPQG